MFAPILHPLVFLVLALGLPAREAVAQAGQEDSAALAEAERWQTLLERDQTVSFTRRSSHDARVRILGLEAGDDERAQALMAIGCTVPQPVRDRPLLEDLAVEGTEDLRAAALLALGEFGEGADASLLLGLEDSSAFVRGCSMWALLRTGRRSSSIRVEAVAGGDSEDAYLANELLITAYNPSASRESDVVGYWLALRWGAARRFGLVDGQSWKMRLVDELLQEPKFLDGVVLASVASRPRLGTLDHLLTLLLEYHTPAHLRACARAMPDELAMLIESGLWTPVGKQAWTVILDEIDIRGTESQALALLLHAMEVPEVSMSSLRLVARAGLSEVLLDLEQSWPDLSIREKELACQAWAYSGGEIPTDFLIEFRNEPNINVRAQVRVASAQLDNTEAHQELRAILLDPDHKEYFSTIRACLQQGDGPLIRGYLEDILDDAEGDMQIEIATVLALQGVASARKLLKVLMRAGFPRGERGVRCLRALALRDPAASMDLFVDTFPVERDLKLNVALASAIVRAQHNSAFVFLRKALWSGPFDRSVLAGQVIVQVGGIHTLRDELNRAPIGASITDLRRVGFALGAWGGLREVEFLKTKLGLRMGSPVLQGALLAALGRRTH